MVGSSPAMVDGLRFYILLITAPFFCIWILVSIKPFTFLLSLFDVSNFSTTEWSDMLKACIEKL